MFIIFLLKTILIVLTYFTLIVSLLVLRQYMKQLFAHLKRRDKAEEHSEFERKAKTIVLTANLSVLAVSLLILRYTAEWQLALVENMKTAASEQPVFVAMIVFLVLYPFMALRKWAMKSDEI